jgi:hypothetical protein
VNREQRRHPEEQPPQQQRPPRDVRQPDKADVEEARTKSSGHGKKTADKWNQ